MTVDELLARESIRNALASYNMSGDRLRLEEFLAVFAEDGVLVSIGSTSDESSRIEGREAIREFMTNFTARPRPAHIEAPKFLRHHLTTSLIELTGPDAAKARTYFSVYTQSGLDHLGYYSDDFRKNGDLWQIAERRVRVEWKAPNSLFRTCD